MTAFWGTQATTVSTVALATTTWLAVTATILSKVAWVPTAWRAVLAMTATSWTMLAMARPGSLQALFLENHERFVQRVERIDGCRVVIRALAAVAPVGHDEVHVEEPALDLALARADRRLRALAECDRR